MEKSQADVACDGTADDSEINAILATMSAGTLKLTTGNFAAIANLVVPDNVTLEGSGPGTIITFSGSAISEAGAITLNSNSTCSNLKAVLAAGAGSVGHRPNVIAATSETNVLVEKCWVVGDQTVADDGSNQRQDGIYFNNCSNSRIINNHVAGNKRNGIDNSYGCTNNIIEGNVSTSNGYYGIILAHYCTGNIIRGNMSNSNGTDTGIGIEVTIDCNENVISNNVCQLNTGSTAGYGIDINTNSYNNTITGNNCSFNKSVGISLNTTSNYNIISGNVCNSASWASVAQGRGIRITGSSSYNEVVGNTCNGNTVYGIDILSNSNNVSLNSVSNYVATAQYGGATTACNSGIKLASSHNNCTGNTIYNITTNGIYARGTYNSIMGNHIYACGDDGIELSGTSGDNTDYNNVSGNTSEGNAGYGINIIGGIYANYNDVKNNSLWNNTAGALADTGISTVTANNSP